MTHITRIIDTSLRSSPFQPLLRWKNRGRLAGLTYHTVREVDGFEAQLRYVLRASRPVTLEEVIDASYGRKGLPKNAVLLTFDDADRPLIDLVMPLLLERGVPGVACVVAGLLDTNEMFWWEAVEEFVRAGGNVTGVPEMDGVGLVRALKQVPNHRRVATLQELAKTTPGSLPNRSQLRCSELSLLESAGIAVANHSWSHPCLTKCSASELTEEINQAHTVLTQGLGHPPRAFAYPNGDCDGRVRAAVAEAGYEAGFLFDHRLSTIPPADPLRISRVRVDSTNSIDRFRIILSGLHPAIHRLRGGH
jgi:peptidoglycan/xylan/chitin deacetylase (PgdA/CDA1 family)